MPHHELEYLKSTDTVLDSLPDSVLAALEVRDRWFARLPPGSNGEEFVLDELQKWAPGQVLRVAFLGGDDALRADIVSLVQSIATHCNIKFDFGDGPSFRSWSPDDHQYSAEIRVSFDLGGYFSLVGNDSADPLVGVPGGDVGGGPGQRSLNLGGFDVKRPSTWKGTVLHEFLHALAFKHEHTNLNGPCQNEFRWEDDPGYQPTRDSLGRYIPDASGARPGIYTYLAGYPNGWSKAKVDHNLRPSAPATQSAFDRASVMLYRFDPLFYKSASSPCQPSSDGQSMSPGDIDGLRLLYPRANGEVCAFVDRRQDLIAKLEGAAATDSPAAGDAVLEGNGYSLDTAAFAGATARRLRTSLAHL